jgi:hypothetical protein
MTDRDLIKALGGPRSVARAIGASPQAVSNWYKRGIPAHHHLLLWRMAVGHGIDWHPPGAWGLAVTPLPAPALEAAE